MSTTRPTSGSQPNLNVSITSSATTTTTTTTTTQDGETTAHSSSPNIQSVVRNSTRVPSFLIRQHRSNPSSPRNILDRLIPCRSQTDMQLAQHLLSPLSHRAGDHYDSEQQDSPRQVNPILTFGNKVVRVKPMASLACGTTHKSKFEFPTLPHRVMVAREPFNEHGLPMMQSTHWAPSPNFVVALKGGIYVYNENHKKTEVCINDVEDDNPFCHVLWAGDSIISASMGGEIAIRDLNTPDCHIKWRLSLDHGIYSMALGQDHLLTCAASPLSSNEVGVYDLRQTGSILSLEPDYASRSLSWSPNGNFLAVGCDFGISLWDVRQPSKEMNFLRNTDESLVRGMNWCPWKSNILCSGTEYPKPSICLHNATTGELIDDYKCVVTVSGIQFNVELEQVATSHDDFSTSDATTHDIPGTKSSVQLWEFTSNKLNPIHKISYHKDGIISMAASANSSQLLTLGGDEKLCLWNWKNKTAPHSNANSEAGFQTTRSQLDAFNLIR